MSEKLYQYKKIKNQGAHHFLIKMQGEESWKHHSWDGPAIKPIKGENSPLKKKYYIYGIEYDLETYKEALNNREGVPYHKQ